VAPPGNQAANGENKLQPVAMGGPGLLDLGCKSSLLFAKFGMAIWCRVSGVRFREACSTVIGQP